MAHEHSRFATANADKRSTAPAHGPTHARDAAPSTMDPDKLLPLESNGDGRQAKRGTTCDQRGGFGPLYQKKKERPRGRPRPREERK
jgi:hypothetical protein